MLRSRTFHSFFAGLVLFTALAGDAVRNTLGWYGWGVVLLAIAVGTVALLASYRDRIRPGSLPYPLLVFLLLATASIAWSFYPGASALGVAAQWLTTASAAALALILDWTSLLRTLGRVLKLILGLSLLFEIWVAIVVQAPVLPLWVDYPEGKLPLMLFWSRNLLFEGGPIQGILGNSSLLAFAALLAVIVFAVQLAMLLSNSPRRLPGGPTSAGHKTRRRGIIQASCWLVLAAIIIALTRSATIALILVVLALVVAMVVLVRRTAPGRPRAIAYSVMALCAAIVVALGFLLRGGILSLLGKSSDLTGRLDIWQAVIGLAEQRPVFGWGWISYWVPWVEPFDDLVVRNGVVQLHAHNAWLDVWMQLGIVGIVVFAALVLSTLTRSWFCAVDASPPLAAPAYPGAVPRSPSDAALSLLPLLLLVALLVQSLAESRLLVEYGWLLLAFIAIKTRPLPSAPPEAVRA